MSQSPEQIYLFTMFGTRAHALEAMRPLHNRVAGAPEDVAAAKALSDLSHMVYTTVDEQSPAFVIMDLWTDPSGFTQFFTEPERQKRQTAGGLFRGSATSREQARLLVDQVRRADLHKARAAGHLSHEMYFRLAEPGAPESLELLAVDGWFDREGMLRYYAELDASPALDGLFTAPPSTWLLQHPAGEWIEW